MKQCLNAIIYCALLLPLLMTSCKKQPKYSCDQGLETYAEKMMESNQEITRVELVKHSLDTQMAIFRSLSPLNKKRIYNEKIEVVLNTDTTLTQADILHLQKLKNYSSASLYLNKNSTDESFLNNWEHYALDTLKWSQKQLEIYAYTWMTMDELNSISKNSGTKDCTCRSTYFGCGIGQVCDTDVDCNVKKGCGFLGDSNCAGLCPADQIEPIQL